MTRRDANSAEKCSFQIAIMKPLPSMVDKDAGTRIENSPQVVYVHGAVLIVLSTKGDWRSSVFPSMVIFSAAQGWWTVIVIGQVAESAKL